MRPHLTILGLSLALVAVQADAAPEAEEGPPTWRFRKQDRPIKVVSLAGSVGAFHNNYAEQLENMCSAVEVKNLSKTGLGNWALRKRFQEQVLGNRYLNFAQEGWEYWLLLGGGLNSVATPERSNHYARQTITMAHRRGMKVLALTLTPWGDDADRRWREAPEALEYHRATRKAVDFIMGRLTPRQALGVHVDKRKVAADSPWDPSERPDIAVDVYDSPLRDAGAPLRDLEEAKRQLSRDSKWKRAHADLSEAERAAALEKDAAEAIQVPRWFMKKDLRAFDHIHPNENGHRIMARAACAKLPASWGCSCN